MSSTNEEISPPPPKPKQSPLEFRNTDLVSRLLAATPPYLYNMPLVPHSFFFSEMLRSLVQGKTEAAAAAARVPPTVQHRRSRKRTWSHGRTDTYKQMSPNTKCDNTDMPPPNWTPKTINDKDQFEINGKSNLERPLELTMSKIPLNNNTKMCHTDVQSMELKTDEISPHKTASNMMLLQDKPEMQSPSSQNGHIPLMFPSIPNLPPQETTTSSSDLILPPPPPIWYPPIYPPPYGIDPLHFFIDLRVSGHIYDRKNSKEHSNINMNLPHGVNPHLQVGNPLHVMDHNPTINSTLTPSSIAESINNFGISRDLIKQSARHASAFTVPTPSMGRNDPLNLSGTKYQPQQKMLRFGDDKPAKFDIKSMGFDNTSDNNVSTNYILKNLTKIYKDLHEMKQEERGIDLTSPKQEFERENEVNVKNEENNDNDNREEEKHGGKDKKCKDLSALIGLELVVDYVKHEKPKPSSSEDSITDIESNVSSPAVEVVTISDIDNKIN